MFILKILGNVGMVILVAMAIVLMIQVGVYSAMRMVLSEFKGKGIVMEDGDSETVILHDTSKEFPPCREGMRVSVEVYTENGKGFYSYDGGTWHTSEGKGIMTPPKKWFVLKNNEKNT